MKTEYITKIRESLQFIFPNLTFNVWEKDDRGSILVSTDIIPEKPVVKFNPELLEMQFDNGNVVFFNDTIRLFADIIDRKFVKKMNKYRNRMRGRIHTLTKGQLEYAFANSKSCKQASRVLGVDIRTFKKYVAIHGLEDVYEGHKNPTGIGVKQYNSMVHKQFPLSAIIQENKHPNYSEQKLKKRLISEFILEEKCNKCGYSERRHYDQEMPLILEYKDGNRKNKHIDNLELLCYNCTFLIRPLSGKISLNKTKQMVELLKLNKEEEVEIEAINTFDHFNPNTESIDVSKEDIFDKFNKR